MFGPKYKVTPEGDNFRVDVIPPEWAGFKGTWIMLNADQFNRFQMWLKGSILIQDAFPELNNSQREILMTGIGPEEWNENFKDDE